MWMDGRERREREGKGGAPDNLHACGERDTVEVVVCNKYGKLCTMVSLATWDPPPPDTI